MRKKVEMRIINTHKHYGIVAILFHWVMTILLIGLIILGLYMAELPIGIKKLQYFRWHKEYGILVLFLGSVRLAWRLLNPLPNLSGIIPPWQEFSARLVHRVFYIFILLMPISGWILTSAAGLPVSFFGLFVLPDLVAPDKALMETMIEIHEWMGFTFIALISIHTFAALVHHFYYKDDVLKRMLK